ncbi:MAG: integration host factor subunit beta [Xanthobacteraceae bacterium]|nr:integration host factor subunit beta [Xanthobacteraceae bacterium]
MIKSELVDQVHAKNRHLTRQVVNKIVDAFFDRITLALAENERVEVRGFGVFSSKKRPARLGRNPRTGQQVSVPDKKVPFFKMGKELKTRLNKPDKDGTLAPSNQVAE